MEYSKDPHVLANERFLEMSNIYQAYFPEYQAICKMYRGDSDVERMLQEFVIGQLGSKKGVRGYVLNKCCELARGDGSIVATHNPDMAKLTAAFELLLASMYCYNVAADRKAGFESQEQKRTAFKTRDVVVGLSQILIEHTALRSEKKRSLTEIFTGINERFYIGETYDTIINLYANIGKTINEVKDSILKEKNIEQTFGISRGNIIKAFNYLQQDEVIKDFAYERTYGINAVMFEEIGEIVSVLVDELSEEKKKSLKQFGKWYGMSMQVINDIQDFSLDLVESEGRFATREKLSSDVFSDIKTGKITWPIKYALESHNIDLLGDLNIVMGNTQASYGTLDELRKKSVELGIIKRTVTTAMAYAELAKGALSIFSKQNNAHVVVTLTNAALSMAKLSKYVKVLNDKYHIKLLPSKRDVKKEVEHIKVV